MQCNSCKTVFKTNFWGPKPISQPAMQRAVNHFAAASARDEEKTLMPSTPSFQ